MERKNYKTVEDRPELTTEQIMAGMNFASVANRAPVPKRMPFNSLIIGGLSGVVIVSAIFVYLSAKTTRSIQYDKTTVDSVTKVISVPRIDSMPLIKTPVVQPQKNEASIPDTA